MHKALIGYLFHVGAICSLCFPLILHYRCGMKIATTLLTLTLSASALATTYELPSEYFDVIGSVSSVEAKHEDTLLGIARRLKIGQDQMEQANPDVDRWLPGAGTQITVPSHHVLPSAPRKGIVLNLPEMRLYYYPPKKSGQLPQVQTYPIGIGRMDWGTPLGRTTITAKTKDPSWTPTENIRREHAERGDPLPRVVPAGPNNPLGRYAMRLGIPGYLIHSTNKPFGVGMRVSHGCIRMLPEDIEYLFPQLPVGTPVAIINQPVKAGWYGGKLYLEVHPPLEEHYDRGALVEEVMLALDDATERRPAELDNAAINREEDQQTGLPTVISTGR